MSSAEEQEEAESRRAAAATRRALRTVTVAELVRAELAPDITHPRWSQQHFLGRFRHFCAITNPLNLFVGNAELERAKETIENYK